MTEQEKRENAIEEMKSVAEKYCEVIEDACGCERECIHCRRMFGELYNAGEREAAKHILQMLFEEWHYFHGRNTTCESVTLSTVINKICLQFGLEIEE